MNWVLCRPMPLYCQTCRKPFNLDKLGALSKGFVAFYINPKCLVCVKNKEEE